LEIFKSRSIDPWQLTLTDDVNNSKPVTASVASLGALNYRAVDRLVQEDSVQLQWSGKAQASAGFIAKERVDYSSLPEQAAVVFDVNVDKKPTADVKLSLHCGSDCSAEKSITDNLNAANAGQWQTLSVSLNCFKKVKLDMLLSPFTLTTAGELSLRLHHVRIESTPAVTISCP
jgi:beta-glucosidase